MKANFPVRGALVAALALASAGLAQAAAPQLLSEREMSGVYGQGLSSPLLDAMLGGNSPGAARPSESSTGNALNDASLAALSAQGNQSLEQRQALAVLQNSMSGMQNTLQITRNYTQTAGVTMAVNLNVVIPQIQMMGLFMGMPLGSTLGALQQAGSGNNNNSNKGPGH